jgi:hypothetical protein
MKHEWRMKHKCFKCVCLRHSFDIRHLEFVIPLFDKPYGHWVTIEFAVARLNRSYDDKDDVENVEQYQKRYPDQDDDQNCRDHVVNQHGQLEVE